MTSRALVFVLLISTCAAADDKVSQRLATDVIPVLRKHCFACHGNKEQEAGLNLQRLITERPLVRHRTMWKKVIQQLKNRGMPPKESRQPTKADRRKLSKGIETSLAHVDWSKIRNPGSFTARRLTNSEYNHTVRDLLGITSNPANKFPADLKGSSGFDNSSNTLFIQTLLFEKYLQAAAECVMELKLKSPVKGPLTVDGNRKRKINAFLTKAFRRPPTAEQLAAAVKQYQQGGQSRLTYVTLLSPYFLIRTEKVLKTKEVYRVDNWDLASRLSYFLWASTPDEELLSLAKSGKLARRKTLVKQVSRMLADRKADSLGSVFASQWLGFEHLGTRIRLDPIDNPWCTDTLMNAMRAESAMFFVSLLRNDRPVQELITADYTYLNQELAKHYGIHGVKGAKMRRVKTKDARRGGILTQGSVLAVTSFPDRTSPVGRGKWILTNLLGTPPPEPPPNASELAEKIVENRRLTFRQKMALHRHNPKCNSCHRSIDPLGLSLENYDKFGRWRTRIRRRKVDASGELPNGTKFKGPAGLKRVIVEQRINDLTTQLTRKMLAYALGRQLEYYDEPAVRKIVADVKRDKYQLRSLVLGVVQSFPFQYKKNR